jgi:hypothetical protein
MAVRQVPRFGTHQCRATWHPIGAALLGGDEPPEIVPESSRRNAVSLRTTRLKDATRVGDFAPHSSDLEQAQGWSKRFWRLGAVA